MTEREKVAAKIRALMVKTVANGCTEDEAVAAAAMVAKLLARHNMSTSEAELRENPFARAASSQPEDEIGERLVKVSVAIAELTGARQWRSPVGMSPVEITFFGFEHEVQIADYLLAICARAMRDGRADVNRRYALLVPARRRCHLLAFLDGMRDNLAKRIRAQIPKQPEGTGLVPVRTALIDQALEDEGLRLKKARGRGSRTFEDAYGDGQREGNRVSLNRAMSEERGSRLQIR